MLPNAVCSGVSPGNYDIYCHSCRRDNAHDAQVCKLWQYAACAKSPDIWSFILTSLPDSMFSTEKTPLQQLQLLVVVHFIWCIWSENGKQHVNKLSLMINSSDQVEMSICHIKDNERNSFLVLLAQPAHVLMCEITQGGKIQACKGALIVLRFDQLCRLCYRMN